MQLDSQSGCFKVIYFTKAKRFEMHVPSSILIMNIMVLVCVNKAQNINS